MHALLAVLMWGFHRGDLGGYIISLVLWAATILIAGNVVIWTIAGVKSLAIAAGHGFAQGWHRS